MPIQDIKTRIILYQHILHRHHIGLPFRNIPKFLHMHLLQIHLIKIVKITAAYYLVTRLIAHTAKNIDRMVTVQITGRREITGTKKITG